MSRPPGIHAVPANRRLSGIVNRLRQAEGGIVSCAELHEAIYGDDPNGGILDMNTFRIAVHKLRRMGFPIASHKGRGWSYAANNHASQEKDT